MISKRPPRPASSREPPCRAVLRRAESRRVELSWRDVPLVVVAYTGYYDVGHGGIAVVARTEVGDELLPTSHEHGVARNRNPAADGFRCVLHGVELRVVRSRIKPCGTIFTSVNRCSAFLVIGSGQCDCII